MIYMMQGRSTPSYRGEVRNKEQQKQQAMYRGSAVPSWLSVRNAMEMGVMPGPTKGRKQDTCKMLGEK